MSLLQLTRTRRQRLPARRHFPLFTTQCGALLLSMLLMATLQFMVPTGMAHAASRVSKATHRVNDVSINPNVQHLQAMANEGRLAPTVKILDALPPTTILQFPLVPSGIKALFPKATGLVTVVRGSRTDSTSDTVTLDVQNMPPNITFTIFFIELASKPFGNVQYVADLTTRGDGSGETVFQIISFVAFAMDARHPGSSQDDREALTSGTNLEHLGMWFASLQDAQKVLSNNALTGTIFDGGNPPLHAGPQAMTDGQVAPVF
jgi:hypothetical protein